MSLSDLAALGSFISGIAVVATLAFLLLQTRQTIRNQRSLMQQGRTARIVDLMYRQMEPQLMEAVQRGRDGDTTLDPSQVETFLRIAQATLTSMEDTYLQHKLGTIDPAVRMTSTSRLADLLAQPGMRAGWNIFRPFFAQDFAEHCDRLISETPLAPPSDRVAKWKADVDTLTKSATVRFKTSRTSEKHL
ncbi:MAG TPA: hypothetical protein VJ476_09940 [Rhizomicrobium sp.]|nr:hypothetical protein [Rhizomicrobium sp.]